jgi:hypothetical protein
VSPAALPGSNRSCATVCGIESAWPAWLRVAFRFVVCFFAITTLYLAVGHLGRLIPGSTPVVEAIQDKGLFAVYDWGVTRLFGQGVVYASFHGFVAYMTTAVVAAAFGAAVWSLIDRRRTSYRRAHAALRIYLRYLLAAVALSYGAAKVIPSQFLPPSLIALLTPIGEVTPMRLMWHFMGTSMLHVVFAGLIEVTGGLLLLFRRTTTLGALLLTAAFTNVAVLNFGYNVGVQLNSTIYALMALVLLAPDARRLATAILGQSSAPAGSPRVPPWLVRSAKAGLVALLIGVNVHEAYVARSTAIQLPDLYGIYEVNEFERDGVHIAPGDPVRWRRLVIAERGSAAIQWTADARLDLYGFTDAPDTGTLTLTGRDKARTVLSLHYTREPGGVLEVAGPVDGHSVRARLKAIDVAQFPLRRGGPR